MLPRKSGLSEGFPDEIVQKIHKIDEMRQKRNKRLVLGGAQISSVTSLDDRRWRPGTVLKVAFKGGDSFLYKKISSAAQEWTCLATLKWISGIIPRLIVFANGVKVIKPIPLILESDSTNRVWAHVGLDCIDPAISGSNTASINFEGFTSELPSDYKGTVMHEFGHALGFQHEHQTPAGTCENEFDWPKVYKYMLDEYEWSQVDTDYNFRKLPYESAYPLTEYDPKSIMNYYLPWQVFINGKKSKCFYGERIVELSQNDRVGNVHSISL